MKRNKLKILLIVASCMCIVGLFLSCGAYVMGGRYPSYWSYHHDKMWNPSFWHNWNYEWDNYGNEIEEYWDDWADEFTENFDEEQFSHVTVVDSNHENYQEYLNRLREKFAKYLIKPSELSQVKFNEVEFDILSGDVVVDYGNGNQIELEQIDDENFLMYKVEDKLHIVERQTKKENSNIHLTLGFDIEDVSMDSVSGNLTVVGGTYQELNFSTVSGNLKVEDAKSKELKVDTVSGNTILNQVELELAEISTTSGDLQLQSANVHTIEMDMVSGNLRGNSTFDELEVDGVSGDVELQVEGSFEEYDIEIEAKEIQLNDQMMNRSYEKQTLTQMGKWIDIDLTSSHVNLQFSR